VEHPECISGSANSPYFRFFRNHLKIGDLSTHVEDSYRIQTHQIHSSDGSIAAVRNKGFQVSPGRQEDERWFK